MKKKIHKTVQKQRTNTIQTKHKKQENKHETNNKKHKTSNENTTKEQNKQRK
jgi:hypothetical protein